MIQRPKLGSTPLPDGMLRVFRANGSDGLSYLSAQPLKYVPIGDKIELNLGADPSVTFRTASSARSFATICGFRLKAAIFTASSAKTA
jgi:hypothetical protein